MSEYQEDYSYRYLLISDTKKGLYDSLKALNIKAAKSLRKGELVNMLDDVFTEKPLYIIDRLPKQEQDILSHLVGCKQSEYVELPISETRLGLEIHHLVVTEVVGDKWRLFMPDSIRKHIDKCAMRDMSIYPGMEE